MIVRRDIVVADVPETGPDRDITSALLDLAEELGALAADLVLSGEMPAHDPEPTAESKTAGLSAIKNERMEAHLVKMGSSTRGQRNG